MDSITAAYHQHAVRHPVWQRIFALLLYALALVGSGLSSSAIGTLAGQVVMQGFIRRQIPVWLRRLVTMLPAFVVIVTANHFWLDAAVGAVVAAAAAYASAALARARPDA